MTDEEKAKAKAVALNNLEKILAEIRHYASMKQTPPPGLVADALAIASQFPDGDIQSKLEAIKNAEQEAIAAYTAAAISQNAASSGASWFDSPERRAFDKAVSEDPLKAMADHFKDPRVAANRDTLNDIIADKDVSGEKFKQVANDAMSEEMRYKRNAFFHHAPLEIEKLKQLGKEEERKSAERDLADVVKEEIFDQVVLKRKEIRRAESRSTDHEVVIEEDKHLICQGVKHAVEVIEHGIEGGLAAVGKAGHMAKEVIQDVLAGDVEQAAIKVNAQQRANEAAAEESLRQEAVKAQQAEIAAAQEAVVKKEEIIVEAVDVKQEVKRVKSATSEVQVDEAAQDKAKSQADLDKEAKKAAMKARKGGAKIPIEGTAITIIEALKKHDSGSHHAPIVDPLQRNKSHSHTQD